ncbi:MAG: hypothetical protein EBZ48_14245 [Proteobacteria bacterium]|nr:hypothetical protein [Pseudomonadota bacterium]
MPEWVVQFCGWIPGILFPAAAALQLFEILKSGRTDGISSLTWSLLSLANACLYIYTQKYFEFQSIFGFLVTSMIQATVVLLTLKKRKAAR